MNIKYSRPFLYPKQASFINDESRYTVIEASTKSGKTTGCIVWLFEQALQGGVGHNFWWVAPVYLQSKIAFKRLQQFIVPKKIFKVNKSELTITLINGSVIHFKSADKPEHLYGDDVYAVVVDEASRCKEDAWFSISSVITATMGKVKIIGNVRGKKNWMYEMARAAQAGKEGFSFHVLNSDDALAAGIIKKEAIDFARNTLPEQVFRELYYNECFDNVQNPFAYSFDITKHVSSGLQIEELPLYLSFDFNVEPITCLVCQHTLDFIRVLDEFRLMNSNIIELCERIKSKYGDNLLYITGDASGSARSALSATNYYQIIKKSLRVHDTHIKLPGKNPSIHNSRVLTNSILSNFKNLKIDSNCKYLIEDLRYVSMDADGGIDKGKDKHRTHLLDCFRYYLNTFHSRFIAKFMDVL